MNYLEIVETDYGQIRVVFDVFLSIVKGLIDVENTKLVQIIQSQQNDGILSNDIQLIIKDYLSVDNSTYQDIIVRSIADRCFRLRYYRLYYLDLLGNSLVGLTHFLQQKLSENDLLDDLVIMESSIMGYMKSCKKSINLPEIIDRLGEIYIQFKDIQHYRAQLDHLFNEILKNQGYRDLFLNNQFNVQFVQYANQDRHLYEQQIYFQSYNIQLTQQSIYYEQFLSIFQSQEQIKFTHIYLVDLEIDYNMIHTILDKVICERSFESTQQKDSCQSEDLKRQDWIVILTTQVLDERTYEKMLEQHILLIFNLKRKQIREFSVIIDEKILNNQSEISENISNFKKQTNKDNNKIHFQIQIINRYPKKMKIMNLNSEQDDHHFNFIIQNLKNYGTQEKPKRLNYCLFTQSKIPKNLELIEQGFNKNIQKIQNILASQKYLPGKGTFETQLISFLQENQKLFKCKTILPSLLLQSLQVHQQQITLNKLDGEVNENGIDDYRGKKYIWRLIFVQLKKFLITKHLIQIHPRLSQP